MPSFRERLTRRKIVDLSKSELRRALTFLDLTLLGIGSTIGVGFYVLVGQVAIYTGPAVILSFLIAAIASVFAGLCYAEFGARVPKAGSAYVYSYVCVGEFVAFVIGWNLVLEYIIGASSVARGFSSYIDVLANKTMSGWLAENVPLDVNFLSEYPDFLSFGLILFVSSLLAIGIRESSTLNNIFSGINLVIVVYVIIAAATKIDVKNWELTKNDTLQCNEDGEEGDWGEGGFAPHGFSGIMNGAATCFFGFVGFDCIATTGEEAINPARNIPLSISISLLVIFLAYFGMSATVTLSMPYCLLDPDAALVAYFDDLDMPISKWIVSIGALFGFSASMIGVLLPLPRIIYAMATDGVIFRFLSKINKRFQTPLIATILTGVLAGLLAMFFDLQTLVDMMSIGTLMAYTIVAVSVMLLRYTPDPDDEEPNHLMETAGTEKKLCTTTPSYTRIQIMRQLFNLDKHSEPTELSGSVASIGTLVYCILVAILSLLLVLLQDELYHGEVGAIVGVVIMAIFNIINIIILARQPESKKTLTFKVPFVPWMPALSAFINLYLMFNLSPDTWIRFAVWMGIGELSLDNSVSPIYFFYGMAHSTEELKAKGHKFGIDNPGGPGGSHSFVIPTINVQLATPVSTVPNTPKGKRIEKKSPKPISPLALEEAVKNIPDTQEKENDIQKALESLDNVVNGSLPPNDSEVETEGIEEQNFIKSASEGIVSIASVSKEIESHARTDDIDGGNSSHFKQEASNATDEKESKNIKDAEEAEEEEKEEEEPNTKQMTEASKIEQEVEAGKNSMPKSLRLVMSQLLQNVAKTAPIDTDKQSEKSQVGFEKVDKKKPEPLVFLNESTDSSKATPLHSSSSVPVISASSPTIRTSPPSRSSVPNTPVTRRHPTKLLKRNSSFDEIPPSSADSPLARRVDKFFIIPVKEPDLSDSDSSPLPSPSPSNRPEGQDALMTELRDRFKFLQNSEKEETEHSIGNNNIRPAESEESLKKQGSSSDLSESPAVGHVREYKRLGSKDMFFLGEGLDTIRERGESSINVEDTLPNANLPPEKPVPSTYVENQKMEAEMSIAKDILGKGDSRKSESTSIEKKTEESKFANKEETISSEDPHSSKPNSERVNKLKALFSN
ncbi:high affinity cationic amino acid transporter 1-like [Palaemon carinicauda]|uniref:high affinity cationic amino acid transporter 1-like n=1 Tax=Palaemon carinicauda TaxID=392227 RepID=UPI0035B572A7